ncbi:mate-domain-containing protein [Kalaharituber pfeilii]|nr:mate-domain-containing protein [Kalaharituber pfeilii]
MIPYRPPSDERPTSSRSIMGFFPPPSMPTVRKASVSPAGAVNDPIQIIMGGAVGMLRSNRESSSSQTLLEPTAIIPHLNKKFDQWVSDSIGNTVGSSYGTLAGSSISVSSSGVTMNLLENGHTVVGDVQSWPDQVFALARNSGALIVQFLLQYLLNLIPIFSAGSLGKDELAAVSLATMTANLTGYAFYQGLSTALEALCVESYSTRAYSQMGLHFQRCAILLMLVSVPIGAIWAFSPYLLRFIVPNQKLADLAGGYLQILFLGAPGYALFEAGKKYLEAQGKHNSSTVVLGFLAPFSAMINFALVCDGYLGLGFGFYGAPTAVAASIQSQVLSLQLLTIFSSYFGNSVLAAQSILATLLGFIYQFSYGMSLSSCTAVAQYIDAGNIASARRSAYLAIGMSLLIGFLASSALLTVRDYVAIVFSRDSEVLALVTLTLPICALYQVMDVLSSVTGAILKGQGRQYVAARIQVPVQYGLAMPISIYTSFKLEWGIRGLWVGSAAAATAIGLVQACAVLVSDWETVIGGAAGTGQRVSIDDEEAFTPAGDAAEDSERATLLRC